MLYFDGYGRGEPIRMACALRNVNYEDKRLSFADFGAMKQSGELPLGSVPVWIEDGVKYVQSNSILRMVGIRNDMYSTDPATAWAIDSVMEYVEDNMGLYGKYLTKQVLSGQANAGQEEVDSICQFYEKLCTLIERRLKGHG